MSSAYEVVCDLVMDGSFNFDELDECDKFEVVRNIYCEATNAERWDYLDKGTDLTDAIATEISKTNDEECQEFVYEIDKILISSCRLEAHALFDLIIERMEENDALCQQDSDYTQYVEGRL